MWLGLTIFFVLMVLALVVGLITNWREESKLKTQFNEKVLKIRRIVDSGGPTSLAEYLEIFPEACPDCGSRTLSLVTVDYAYDPLSENGSYDTGAGHYNGTGSRSEIYCQCGYRIGDSNLIKGFGWDYDSTRVVTEKRVSSPYLSDADSSRIPLWDSKDKR